MFFINLNLLIPIHGWCSRFWSSEGFKLCTSAWCRIPHSQHRKQTARGTDVVTNVCWQMWGGLKNYTEQLNRPKTHSGRISALGKITLQTMKIKAGNSLRNRHAVMVKTSLLSASLKSDSIFIWVLPSEEGRSVTRSHESYTSSILERPISSHPLSVWYTLYGQW